MVAKQEEKEENRKPLTGFPSLQLQWLLKHLGYEAALGGEKNKTKKTLPHSYYSRKMNHHRKKTLFPLGRVLLLRWTVLNSCIEMSSR